MSFLSRVVLAAALAAGLTSSPSAQVTSDVWAGGRVQIGLGLNPGAGIALGASAPALAVFTREATLYADYTPRAVGGRRLRVSLGVGGSVRVLRIASVVGDFDASRFDLNAGVRLGPSFAFFQETPAARAQAFSVMLDPFIRGSLAFSARRVLFAEIGTQAPTLRGGLSVRL